MRTFYYSISLLVLMTGLQMSFSDAFADCSTSQPIKGTSCSKDKPSCGPGSGGNGIFCNLGACGEPINTCWYDGDFLTKNKKSTTKSPTK